jgi:hypothetical protein
VPPGGLSRDHDQRGRDVTNVNYLYINDNQDIWVTEGPAGGNIRPTVERYEGVPDEVVQELQDEGWKMREEIADKIRDLPMVEF